MRLPAPTVAPLPIMQSVREAFSPTVTSSRRMLRMMDAPRPMRQLRPITEYCTRQPCSIWHFYMKTQLLEMVEDCETSAVSVV